MKKLSFVELFGVPGGMSMGFKLAGMRSVGALDNFEEGIETYQKNFRGVKKENVVCADASSPDIVKEFQKKTSLKKGDIDIIIGGPPCQGFSTMGRIKMASLVRNGQRNGNSDARFINDKRNNLYKSFIKFVKKFEPKAIVMENVLGMKSYKGGDVVKQIKEDFKKIGYSNIDYKVLNALDFGVPQSRKRIFFVATRKGKPITWPEETHFPKDGTDRTLLSPNLQNQVTVWEAIGDLPLLKLPEKYSKTRDSERKYNTKPLSKYQKLMRGNKKEIQNNVTRWHREPDLEVFSNMLPGGKWNQLSQEDKDKIGYSDDSFVDKWKRLPFDKHSWTVTSHLHKDGYMYIHPKYDRTISVREAARLQSFPDSFVFYGSRSAQFIQIGNAVPPLLAMAVAKHVKKMISEKEG